jgi:ArsR family transcriptional regulator, nickel/cobalt-responsive transcriptional repressor
MNRIDENRRAEADWIAAIGEPNRLAIIRILAIGEKTVTELATGTNQELVNVSHHLGVMRSAGLVKSERDGRFMRYSLLGARAAGTELELTHESGARVTIPLA